MTIEQDIERVKNTIEWVRHCPDNPSPDDTEETLNALDRIIAELERSRTGRSKMTSTTEKDPLGKAPHEAGAKLDFGKAPVRVGLLEYFPRACLAVANVSKYGAEKYSWGGWSSVPDGAKRYGDAEVRHICMAAIDGATDKESGLQHAAHEAWNALARLELLMVEAEAKQERGEG